MQQEVISCEELKKRSEEIFTICDRINALLGGNELNKTKTENGTYTSKNV